MDAQVLIPQDDETAQLEALDDLIFPAIDGDPSALDASPQAWLNVISTLGEEKVAESRHEYLRYAWSKWQSLRRQAEKNPLGLLAVLKIILMLLGDGT